MATGIKQPDNVEHMFGVWLQDFNNNLKLLFLLGATVLCWVLWMCRNNLVFSKKFLFSPLQVIHSVACWLSSWAILQWEDLQVLAVEGSQLLVQVAKVFFPR